VTTLFSLFAYLWLLLIVAFISPGEIEIWEAVVTFLLFPVLVLVAFAADRGWISCTKKSRPDKKQVELDGEEGR
jgi:solute carrier family 8 (sodium/calcium exchanger)